MAKFTNMEKSAKTNILKTTEMKNSPKNRVKSFIKKTNKEKISDEDKTFTMVCHLVQYLQNDMDEVSKKIQEFVEELANIKKKLDEATISPTKVVEKNISRIALDSKTFESAVNSMFFHLENDDKIKLLDDQEKKFFLQIKCIKVPEANPTIKRITLKHGKWDANSDICFIVKDCIKPKDVDKTIEFYENILEMHNITNIKCIMPFYTASTEYAEYENQMRLVGMYDNFLIDVSIASKFSRIFRAVFLKEGKMPRMVKMSATNLKDQVEKSFKMVPLKICDERDTYLVEFGHNLMKKQEIIENLHHVVQQLNNVFPGGHNNISHMYLKTSIGVTVPLYVSIVNKPNVVIYKLPKRGKDIRGKLTTLKDADSEKENEVEDEVPNKIRKVDEDVFLFLYNSLNYLHLACVKHNFTSLMKK